MKIRTLEISDFKGLKKFKIENLPDIVALIGGSGVGKSTILLAISYLKGKLIAPFQHSATSAIQSLELVRYNLNSCEILVKFELAQSERDYLREECSRDNTSFEHEAYIKLNNEGRVIEERCFDGLRALLRVYERYNDSRIDRFDCIGSSRNFRFARFARNGNTSNGVDLPLQSKRNLSMEEKSRRLKENLIFAKAGALNHIHNFDKNMQVTKEDLFAILKPIQKIFTDIEFTSNYAQFIKESPKDQIVDIDNLSYREKEILFVFTELYYRLKPRNSIILYDEPDIYLTCHTNPVATLLHELEDNNQIWITSHSSRNSEYDKAYKIEDYMRN